MRDDWVKCSFEDLTSSLKRGPFGGDLKKAFFVPSGYAVYEQQHAINNEFTSLRYFIDDKRYQKLLACNVGPGDYIVSCSGTMGKIARLPDNAPSGVINQALLRIRINDKIITHDYFLHLFRSSLFQRKILKDSRGSGMQNMAGIKELKPVPIYIPPLTTQRAIVSKIEELFSELDKGEEDLKKAQEQLKIYRQAVLKKAFEGELTKEWRKRNNSYWFECVLGEILKVSSGKGLTSKKMSGSGYPVYGGNGVNGFHSEFLYERERLIIGRVGVRCGVTHVTQKQSWVTDNALVVTFINPEHFNLKFMKLKLRYENLNKLSSSTAQPVISGAKLYSYNIRIPEINEQIEIVQEIESRLSVCNSIEESIRESLDKSKALRQSILKKALEGTLLSEEEIAACKAAPDYEPASVLLERIKAEKKKK